MKFFLNRNNSAWLRGLETELQESSNAIRLELNRFEQAGLLVSEWEQNRKLYRANQEHPLYDNIHDILLKHIGIDQILTGIILKIGKLERAWLLGDMAAGIDCPILEIVLVGEEIDERYLAGLVQKAEAVIQRKIQLTNIPTEHEEQVLGAKNKRLLLWADKE